MTKIIRVPSITRVNFGVLSERGIEHVATDIESTLCPYGVPKIDQDVLDHLQTQREKGYIKTLPLLQIIATQSLAMLS